ncbi:hypothetical protein AN958_08144 [Leucoagaricus sp. SymC.cos]|nr:hypothetical protein AN958_08144 [Leucoagaricus sp. SymC.cos]
MVFPITGAYMTGTFFGAIFYGIYLVTCIPCFRILFFTESGKGQRWRRPSEIRWPMAIGGLILFVVCALDATLNFSRDYRAFVESLDAEEVLIADWTNIARVMASAFGAWVADYILIYRCWIVYARRWVVIVPSIILYLANLAVSFREYAMMAVAGGIPGTTVSANAGAFRSLLLAFFSTIAAQNVLTTSILIWRIWQVEKSQTRILGEQQRHLRRVMIVLAESGAVYTTFVLLTLITSAAHSNTLFPLSDMAKGIVFNTILARCSPERDRQFTTFHHNDLSTFQVSSRWTTTRGPESTISNRQNKPPDIEVIGADSERRIDSK